MKSKAALFLALIGFWLFGVTGCGGTPAAAGITLDFVQAPSGGTETNAFNEEQSIVLRCASLMESERGIAIMTSRDKSVKAERLLFVALPSDSSIVRVASVPLKDKEYDYDMAQARFYNVTSSSARTATKTYGIPYSDWQAGAVSGSEKFPCCE